MAVRGVFCYVIVHLTVQPCCIVKLFYMSLLQKMLKQIGGLVFPTFLLDRCNERGWVKKSSIAVPHLRKQLFYLFVCCCFFFTCETRQKKKVWGSDFLKIFHSWNWVKNTFFFPPANFIVWSDTECKKNKRNKCVLFHGRGNKNNSVWNWVVFWSPAWFHTWGKKILLWKNDYMRKTLSWKTNFATCPQGSCRSLWLALAFLAPDNHFKSVNQGLVAWVTFPLSWL